MEAETQRNPTRASDASELLQRLRANPTCSIDYASAALGIGRSTA